MFEYIFKINFNVCFIEFIPFGNMKLRLPSQGYTAAINRLWGLKTTMTTGHA